jgi:hypothetical protein
MRILGLITVAAFGAGISLEPRFGLAAEVFYTTANGGAEIVSITVHDTKITTKDVGPTGVSGTPALFPGCDSLAMSRGGTLYAVCGDLFGTQQLAWIDLKSGHANLFGVPTPGLAVMSLTFGPDGTLYAVGGCNFNGVDCVKGNDPNFNSLYTIEVSTGAFTRKGPTGAAEYFMALVFDRHGQLFGVTTTLMPSYVPAVLYQIDPGTAAATKVVDLVGSNQVMGLVFGDDDRLYANDFVANAGLYLIDMKTGFETAIAALPFSFYSNLALVSAHEE